MNETAERQESTLDTEETVWRTPEFSVVETALEVTAYALSTR
ncbi:coenzyme PQQ precursor peptide PqqA [Kitasatospora gansuensis]|uniref:Coenzyme PQQ synthesis protein A n=1 Tax=Kitasatospora gansuensis TaxID=258050 RepID=A0A7W7S7C8_9ACTN|nr:pyrroloquinoline quinone precursor peptide PqqA [Kitasatospora gansuensis]MBB4945243.1 coenzyme PQQ precursor peptide PqqA [Kitasatospora gansuensis]